MDRSAPTVPDPGLRAAVTTAGDDQQRPPDGATSTALLTDRYELTMLDAALRDGTGARTSVFETFARSLPAGRRYGVVAGLDRLVDAIERFRFDDPVLGHLDDDHVVSADTLRWLADYRFTGSLWAYPEGEVYGPGSPVLTVQASFAEAVLLETLVLSVLNHDSAVAAAAARMAQAAGGRQLLEFGGRRTHEQAAVAAARAAYVAGFDATSNLEAGRRYGIPTRGTSAHAFTLVHDDEPTAFAAQVAALGADTTLLVDTYDTLDGLEAALGAGGPELGGVRIDSGDLAADARRARTLLDEGGATDTRIVVSGDLDEHRIAALADAPIDVYGVGTSVVTGAGAPTAGLVYKLVARARTPDGPLEPVAKGGGAKATVGGAKRAWRRIETGAGGEVRGATDVLLPWDTPVPPDRPGTRHRPLQVRVLEHGARHHAPDLDAIRAHHAVAVSELPPAARQLAPGEPGVTVRLGTPDEHTDPGDDPADRRPAPTRPDQGGRR